MPKASKATASETLAVEALPVEALVDTGIQRLLGNLDELPEPVAGFSLFEAPGRSETLASQPLPANRVRPVRQGWTRSSCALPLAPPRAALLWNWRQALPSNKKA